MGEKIEHAPCEQCGYRGWVLVGSHEIRVACGVCNGEARNWKPPAPKLRYCVTLPLRACRLQDGGTFPCARCGKQLPHNVAVDPVGHYETEDAGHTRLCVCVACAVVEK